MNSHLKRIIKKAAYWTVPYGIVKLLTENNLKKVESVAEKHFLNLIKPNIKFKDIYKGQRCFIVCNGPSINEQNLIPLKDEIVFTVSNGYHYKDYTTILPKYHCTPQLTFTPKFTKEVAIDWFKEMESLVKADELFFNITQEPLITENQLFKNKKINYVYFGLSWNETQKDIIDISKKIPGVRTVPIMCLMISMYMGFKEIFLLGVDHDSFRTGVYKYAYDVSIKCDKYIDSEGKMHHDMYTIFHAFAERWRQYRILKKIAKENGIKIYNATPGSALDEFERVNIEEVLKKTL